MNDPITDTSQPNILIVDDSRANLRLLADILTQKNYKARPVMDGSAALKAVKAQEPDLILLDIMMPGIKGYAVCEHLKADRRFRDIPIIFISALQESHDKVEAFAKGGVDYITKPFHPDEVLARIDTHVKIIRLQKHLQKHNEQLEEKTDQLEKALAQVKKLSGLLPLCANCHKIRNDDGYWQDVASYIRKHSEADVTHGVCPDCIKKLYPDIHARLEQKGKNEFL